MSRHEKLIGQTFRDSDFRGRELFGAWIEDCVFEHVAFDRADLRQIRDHGNRFHTCTFVRTNLEGAGIGHKGSRYINCRFKRSKFRHAVFARAEFDNCDFVSCQLKGVDFSGSSFVECRFEGRLEDVWFRGDFPLPRNREEFGVPRKNEMRNVDFSKAELHNLTFSDGCDLATVKIPADGKHKVYNNWPQRLERAAAILESWNDHEKSEGMAFITACYRRTQFWDIINIDDMSKDAGPELTDRILAALEGRSE